MLSKRSPGFLAAGALLLVFELLGVGCCKCERHSSANIDGMSELPYVSLTVAQEFQFMLDHPVRLRAEMGEVFKRAPFEGRLDSRDPLYIKIPGGSRKVERTDVKQVAGPGQGAIEMGVLADVKRARERAAWRVQCLTRDSRDILASVAFARTYDELEAYLALRHHGVSFSQFESIEERTKPSSAYPPTPHPVPGTAYCDRDWEADLAPLPWDGVLNN